MAPLGESTMIWSALVAFLLNACCCIAMTVPTNVQCIDDFDKCRYQCPPGEVQKYCPSLDYKEINNEFCCPGHFRTTTSQCQVCNDVEFMPDVNNCCGCLTCTQCDDIVNDEISFACNRTTNVVCRIKNDSTATANSSCPLMEPTSESPTSSEEVTTPEVIDFTSTPRREPEKSQSRRPLDIFLYVFTALFCLTLVFSCFICICCWCVNKSAGNDQTDVAYTWKVVTVIVAKNLCGPFTCKSTCRAGNGAGGGNGGEAEAGPRPEAETEAERECQRIDVRRGSNLQVGRDEIDDAENPRTELNEMLPKQDHEVT